MRQADRRLVRLVRPCPNKPGAWVPILNGPKQTRWTITVSRAAGPARKRRPMWSTSHSDSAAGRWALYLVRKLSKNIIYLSLNMILLLTFDKLLFDNCVSAQMKLIGPKFDRFNAPLHDAYLPSVSVCAGVDKEK